MIFYYRGVIWFTLSLLISSTNDVFAKYLSLHLPVLQLLFLRFFLGTLSLVPFVCYYGIQSIKSYSPVMHIIRGIILTIAMFLWIKGLEISQIIIGTVISFTIPIITMILAVIYLKENLSKQLWIASIISLGGIILTLNPLNIIFNTQSFAFIFAAILFAVLDIINKKYIIRETMISMLFYSSFIATLITGMFSSYHFKIPNLYLVTYLFFIGIGNNLILYFLLKSFRAIRIVRVAPLRYLEFFFSLIWDYILFQYLPSANTCVGALIVVICSLYIVTNKVNNNRTNTTFLLSKSSEEKYKTVLFSSPIKFKDRK